MKTFAILPAAAAAILALNIGAASSQGAACQQGYQACMTSCSAKASRAIQDGCFQNCEGKNNVCQERIYGARPAGGAPLAAAEPKGPAKEALAKKDKPQEAPQAQVADDRAPQQGQAPQKNQPAPQRGQTRQ